jgi:4-amino-4-deoxy-L-arabinose transferase-like glycosyltransferase
MTLVAKLAAEVSTKPRDFTDSSNLTETAMRPPEAQFRWDRHLALILFLLSFLYLCLFRRPTAMEPDEGIILQGAQRILSGQIPYRDFFSFYTPGSYYSLALLFRIFGSSIVVARTALAFTGAILSLITYLLARRVCSPTVALAMAALATATSLPYRFLVLHNWDSTLWACLAIYCAVRLLERPNLKWSFALGSLASLTVLSEQSKGAGLCLGLGIGLLAIFFLQRESRLLSRVSIIAALVGLAWPFVITFGYFISQHAAYNMLADWLWPLQHYSQANRVPYGYQNWTDEARHAIFASGSLPIRLITVLTISPCLWIPALPLLAAAYLVYWIFQAQRRPELDKRRRYYIIVTASLVGMALTTVLARPDILHFIYFQPLNCLLLAWLLEGRDIPGRFIKSARPYLFGYVVIAFLAIGLVTLLGASSARQRLETRRGVVTTSGKDTVIEYVQNHVPAGETILVYPYLPLYYYLTGTFSPTPYDYFQSGMHTREQADEVVLASGRVKAVLFEIDFAEKIPRAWPNTPLAEIAHDPVADYIVRNFRPCATLQSPDRWKFLFMVRKDLQCP